MLIHKPVIQLFSDSIFLFFTPVLNAPVCLSPITTTVKYVSNISLSYFYCKPCWMCTKGSLVHLITHAVTARHMKKQFCNKKLTVSLTAGWTMLYFHRSVLLSTKSFSVLKGAFKLKIFLHLFTY